MKMVVSAFYEGTDLSKNRVHSGTKAITDFHSEKGADFIVFPSIIANNIGHRFGVAFPLHFPNLLFGNEIG